MKDLCKLYAQMFASNEGVPGVLFSIFGIVGAIAILIAIYPSFLFVISITSILICGLMVAYTIGKK